MDELVTDEDSSDVFLHDWFLVFKEFVLCLQTNNHARTITSCLQEQRILKNSRLVKLMISNFSVIYHEFAIIISGAQSGVRSHHLNCFSFKSNGPMCSSFIINLIHNIIESSLPNYTINLVITWFKIWNPHIIMFISFFHTMCKIKNDWIIMEVSNETPLI